MNSGMAAVRRHAQAQRVKDESERIINAFASATTSKHRATIKIVKRILLNGPYLLNGKSWDVKSRSLGAGVYELSLEEV